MKNTVELCKIQTIPMLSYCLLPDKPHQENDKIEEVLEQIVMEEVEEFGMGLHNETDPIDSQDIKAIDNPPAERYIP